AILVCLGSSHRRPTGRWRARRGGACESPSHMELEEARGYAEALRRLLQHSGLPFSALDAAGRVTTLGRRAAAALGARPGGAHAGQLLEGVVAERHRAQVAQAVRRAQGPGRAGAEPVSARLAGAAGCREAVLSLVPCYGSAGCVTAVLGLVDTGGGAEQAPDAKLPAPVSGVNAWRCTMGTSAAVPCIFELSEGGEALGGEEDAGHSEGFRGVVEQTVKASAPIHACEPGAGATPFESEVVSFESQGGETRYFCVRGLATSGPEMPFGGRLGIAQGYVVDMTRPELALQEASRWHERWRALAQLVFDFVLLVDITEYRILSVWDASSAFDEKLEGRSLADFVEGPDDRAALSDAISAALVAHAGTQEPLTFWNPRRKERIFTRCAMVSDAWDPSALFLGASLAADPGLAAPAPRPVKGSSSSSDIVASRQLEMLGGQAPEPSPSPPPEPSKPPAPPGAGGANKVVSLGAAPLRLSSAALGLAGLPASRKPPGLHRMGETPVPSHPNSEAPAAVPEACPAEEGAKRAPKEPPRAQQRPPGRPPAPLGAGAPPAALVGAVRRGRADAMSDSGRSVRSESDYGARRVFPTRLVVLADDGAERWRSSVQMLAEGVRAVALLAGDGLLRWGMPQEIADAIRQEAYVLNVRDNASGEMLQVADVTGTSMRNLQRHCGSDDELTIFLSPLEDSEDAFETA
ncbi:unnamed protein product, partial [Prorocentrum cordatum]